MAQTETEDAVCDCVMEGETDASVDRCGDHVELPTTGYICTRPAGHDGPHTACNVSEHPAWVWSAE